MDWIEILKVVTDVSMCISVILVWLTAKANNRRKRKEITIQYTDAHESKVTELLEKIKGVYQDDKILLEEVTNDKKLQEEVERYLFSMERLAVGINSGVFDINLLDRTMGQKTIEHYEALQPYIKYIRKNDYQEKYNEFEELVNKLREIRRRRSHKKQKSDRLSRFFI